MRQRARCYGILVSHLAVLPSLPALCDFICTVRYLVSFLVPRPRSPSMPDLVATSRFRRLCYRFVRVGPLRLTLFVVLAQERLLPDGQPTGGQPVARVVIDAVRLGPRATERRSRPWRPGAPGDGVVPASGDFLPATRGPVRPGESTSAPRPPRSRRRSATSTMSTRARCRPTASWGRDLAASRQRTARRPPTGTGGA